MLLLEGRHPGNWYEWYRWPPQRYLNYFKDNETSGKWTEVFRCWRPYNGDPFIDFAIKVKVHNKLKFYKFKPETTPC